MASLRRSRSHLQVEVVGDYRVGATIGKGLDGTVKLATHGVTGDEVAIKIIHGSKMDVERLRREIKHQQMLDHPCVVQIKEVLEMDGSACLVMELASGGSLHDYIARVGRLTEPESRRIFRQIISGIDHCHERNVAHRDLKLENIVLDGACNAKLADFGMSSEIRMGEPLRESCGSVSFAAPELLEKDCAYDGRAVDVWSCGVILYALLCNCLPFDVYPVPEIVRAVKDGRYSMPEYLSMDAKDLISRMLIVDPRDRILIAGIQGHKWFKEDSCAP